MSQLWFILTLQPCPMPHCGLKFMLIHGRCGSYYAHLVQACRAQFGLLGRHICHCPYVLTGTMYMPLHFGLRTVFYRAAIDSESQGYYTSYVISLELSFVRLYLLRFVSWVRKIGSWNSSHGLHVKAIVLVGTHLFYTQTCLLGLVAIGFI